MNEIQREFDKTIKQAQEPLVRNMTQGRGLTLDEIRFLQGQLFGLEQAAILLGRVLKAAYEEG